jgi:cell division septum initiation protein DivIVA
MTKHDEIQALMELAHKLGSNSYCGPWLNDQIPFVEHDMRCDIMPNSSWVETRRLHDGMLNTAKQQAEYLLKAATEKADKIMRDAEKQAENTRKALARDIQKALDSIV